MLLWHLLCKVICLVTAIKFGLKVSTCGENTKIKIKNNDKNNNNHLTKNWKQTRWLWLFIFWLSQIIWPVSISQLYKYQHFSNKLSTWQVTPSHSKSLEVFLRRDGLPHLLVLRLGGVDGVAGVLRHQLALAPHLRPLQTGGGHGVVSPRGPSENISSF